MSGASDRHRLRWTAVKSLVFTVVTVLATTVLALTIRNSSGGDVQDYAAVFTDATSVSRGDDVRVAGVKVGSVRDVKITQGRLARVRFTVRKGVRLPETTIVQIRFRNLVGQRYLALVQPSGVTSSPVQPTVSTVSKASTGGVIPAGHTFGVDQTRPALDLTLLFNGFQPLLRMLDPDDVNRLSEQIVAVFQGEGATVEGLLKSTASLTTTLAEKDQVIGELINSLSSVLTTVNDRSDQLDTTLVTMQQLVSGLAEDRAAIGGAITGMGELTTSVSGLLGETRPAVRKSIRHLGKLAKNLDQHSDEVESFLQQLPVKLDRIGRLSSYGSWLNTYLCSMQGRIPMPQGYMGDLGALPVAERCQ
ncbi:MCE family protein [Nocardioides humi]|uniref:MCE family protein n=1 Tax=Nocardioides humi TaxID=449461 RepID=A0ABN2AXU9_9ACTN|nr:MCE family protein [Nocardioides humi]